MNLSIKTEVRATIKSNSLLVINSYYLFLTVLPLEKMYHKYQQLILHISFYSSYCAL